MAKKITLRIYIILLFTFSIGFSYGGKSQFANILDNDKKLIIPFEYNGYLIIVQARVNNGPPLNFIVDTGAENMILLRKSIADIHRFTYTQRIPIYGADLRVFKMGLLSPLVDFNIGQKKDIKVNFLVLEEDNDQFDSYAGKRIDGIIGGVLLSKYLVEVDFKRKRLVIRAPSKEPPHKSTFQAIPMNVHNDKPYVEMKIHYHDTVKNEKFLCDLGAGIEFMLLDKDDKKYIDTNTVVKGIIGHSISGVILGNYVQLRKMCLGKYNYLEPIASMQSLDTLHVPQEYIIHDGIIGNKFFQHFHLFIDYRHSILYMKSRKKKLKLNHYDRSGLSIISGGKNFNNFEIEYIVAQSPADKSGLKVGDRIISINGFSRYFWSLNKISKKMKSPKTERITFKIDRMGEKMKIEVALRDYWSYEHE